MKKQKNVTKTNSEKFLVIGAIILLVLSAVFGLLGARGFKLINKNGNAVEQKMSISVNGANNEILKNKITSAKIVGGYNHFIVLNADGKVYGWGYNGYGQLGLGNTSNYTTPVYLNMDNVIDITARGNYTAILKKDGTVWMAGYNGNGELGINDTSSQSSFVQVKNEDGTGFLTNIKDIESGVNTMYAITNDGEVYAWGYNGYGQMGFGDTSSRLLPVKLNITNIKQISAGEHDTIALDNNGEIWVAGRNTEGQLGIGNTSNSAVWAKMKSSDGSKDISEIKEVSAGRYHTMLLNNNGEVYSTGYNNYYQLGNGSSSTKSYIIAMTDVDGSVMSNVKHIYASGDTSFVITNKGELYSCGYNNYGQLVQRNTTNLSRFTKVDIDVSVNDIALTMAPSSQTTAYVDNIGRIYTVGYSNDGELGNGTTDTSYLYKPYSISDYKILTDEPIINLKSGESKGINPYFSAGINAMNDGFNMNLTYESLDTSVATVSGSSVVGVGIGTTYIRISDKTNKIYGTVKVNVNEVDGVTYPKIVGGQNHFVSLKSDGTTYTWGLNDCGQLGTGDTTYRADPTKTSINDAIDIAAGYKFTVILKKDGTVWVSGYNGYGTVGDGTTSSTSVFKQVQNIDDVIAISAESNTVQMLKKDGTVWSIGLNSSGEFGNNTSSSSANSIPTKMCKIPNVMQIASGDNHVVLVTADGNAWSVGYNNYGQLGIASSADTMTVPQQIMDETGSNAIQGVKEASCSTLNTYLIKEDGTAYSTGHNNYSQLAGSSSSYRNYVVPMLEESTASKIQNVKHIYAGGYGVMAIDGSNNLYVAGYANYAQNFTEKTTTRSRLHKLENVGKVLSASLTKSTSAQTGAVINSKGKVLTVGYGANGETGSEVTENIVKSWCIQKSEFDISKNSVINLEVKGNQKQIEYSRLMGFNLLTNQFIDKDISFKSLDTSIATVSSTGLITAQGFGTTYIQLTDSKNDLVAKVRVNVNGDGNKAFAKIAGGNYHFVALKGNGTVWTWGLNSNGQLGLDDTTNRTEPTKIKAEVILDDGTTKEEEITDAIDIAAGANWTMILRADGTVWEAGYNGYGQLGDGTTTSTTVFHKVKLDNNGNYLKNIVQITAEDSTAHALTTDGSVYSWGYNEYGEIGINAGGNRYYPVKMKKVSNIVQISAGEGHIVMLDADGSVWSVGNNGYGQFGVGHSANSSIPLKMQDTDGSILYGVREVATGRYHTVIIKEDNTVWSTGLNSNGALGDGTDRSRTRIVQVKQLDSDSNAKPISDAKHINASGDSTYITRQKSSNGENQGMYVCGWNTYGHLFTQDANYKLYATPVETDKDIITVGATRRRYSSSSYQTGAIADINGMVYTVGYNEYGEVGNGTTENTITPVCISQVKLKVIPNTINYKKAGDTGEKITYSVSAGFNLLYETIDQGNCEFKSLDEDIATVADDGTVTATGNGSTFIKVYNKQNDCYARVKVQVNGEQGRTQAKIVGGWNYFVALKSNGEVWTWGYNGYGQLGMSDKINRLKPTKTSIFDSKDENQKIYAIDVAAGAYHTVVLKSDGTVWTTGYNGYGQLGDGTTDNQVDFIKVEGIPEKVVAVSANYYTSYALTENGNVYGWGYNYYGQLGNNSSSTAYVPVKMQKVSNIIQISAGQNYVTMLDADGTVWSVGYNENGQFGLNNTNNYYLPQKMKNEEGTGVLKNIKKVSAGTIHTLALSEDGIAYAVGYNGYGQLGIGNNRSKYLPTKMIDDSGEVVKNIKNVEANGYSSIVSVKPSSITDSKGNTTKTAGIYVTGYNNYGQLFTKNATNRNTLIKVQEDKNIITMASTKNISYQTSAIADDLGLVYTVGYNGNGEMGDDSTSTTTEPTSISEASLKVNNSKIVLNLDTNNITKKIDANTDLGFNLLFDTVTDEVVKFKSRDTKIATVSDTGVVTGKSYGKTQIEVTTNKLPNTVLVDVEVLRKNDITIPKIVSGQDFTIALKADGTVWSWGYNYYGQLGLGDNSNRYKPTQLNINNVVDISAGSNHVLLLTKDGKVYSFGSNSYSQLGRNGNTLVPEEITTLENVTKISAGSYHSMAVTEDGSVYTWGYNGNGQLGNGTSTSNAVPIKIRLKNIIKIATKNQTSTAIDGDGNLYAWGYNGYGQLGNETTSNVYLPRAVLSLSNIVDVAVENNTIIAVDKNGNVLSSGYNGYGNLGNNTKTTRYKFEKVIDHIDTITTGEGDNATTTEDPKYLTDVKSIEAGNNYAIAIKNDGTAVTWGYNGYGQSANGNTKNNLLPVKLHYGVDKDGIDEIICASAGEGTTVLARADGKVWSIGKNSYGQLGDSSVTNKNEFVCISKPILLFEETPIRIKGIGNSKNAKVNMSQGFNLLYNSVDNSELTFTSRNKSIATVEESTGKITSVKKGKTQISVTDKISGQTTSADVYVLGEEDITFPQIESSNYATVTLKANGEVWSYGYNGYGQLGTGDTSNKILPTYTGINGIMQIALGNEHTVAVDKDGHVWTWGYNNYGQLGNGTTGGVSTEKVQVKSPDGEGVLENIISVAAGNSYSVALDKDGNVYTWGYNGYGQLGLGDGNYRALPVKVDSLQGIIKIKAGNVSTFAIDNNNKLWSAGYNGYGNLGDGTTGNKTSFVKIDALENVADVSASPINSTIVLLLDGTVWGFGNNANNALTNVGGAIPQQLQGPDGALDNVTAIGTGYYSGYAITSEEKVVAWGMNNYSQLASGDTSTKSVPVFMKDKDGNDFTDAMIVSGGIYNTELAKNDGTVWSIGYNGYGELGDGSTTSKNKIECISTQYIKLQEREVTLKLSNPEYQINPETVYGFNLLFDVVENNGFEYESSDNNIATVDKTTGKVVAKNTGRAYITLKCKNSDDEARVVINVIAEDKKVREKVEAGNIHSLALKQDGTIWSWGDNSQGEMGNGQINSIKTDEPTQIKTGVYTEVKQEQTDEGSTQITTTQIEVNLDNIKDIAAGYYYNLAVDSDGYVYSWGYNGYGQLGDNTNESKAIPTRIEGLDHIAKVYAYGNTSMAISEQGEIYVWGYKYSKVPTKINFYSKAVDIHGKLILAEDGSVWYLSENPSRIAGLQNIVEIASGDNYYSALDTKGQVWVWGYNGYGQLSQGNRSNVDEPVPVKVQKNSENTEEEPEYEILKDIVEIKAGNDNLQMVSKGGSLYVSGYSGYGQLGTGEYKSYNTIATKAKNMDKTKFVDSNAYHSIASDTSGFVYTSGYNAYGELGNGTYTQSNEFGAIGDTYVHVSENRVAIEEGKSKNIKASLDNKFNLIKDTVDSGNITYESLNNDIATVDSDGTINAKQMGTVEIIATHTITHKSTAIFVQVVPTEKTTVPKVEIGDTHSAALKADGTVWTWGNNSDGQLGIGDNVSKTYPIKVMEIENAIDVSVGYYDTVVVKKDGTVWSWGYNGYGQLGDGTSSSRTSPVQVIRQDGAPLTKIVKVSAGTYRTVALDEDGNVWVWGYRCGSSAVKFANLKNIIDISPNYAVNQSGEVFKVDTQQIKLQLANIIRVSESSNHALFLTKAGKGYSIGANNKGQLGDGTTTAKSDPVMIQNSTGVQTLTDIKELKAGTEFSMAIMKNGDTYTWGSNENYKLATDQENYRVYPKKNNQTNKAIFGDAGPNSGAIIDEQGYVYTWGLGTYGNLGNKLYVNSSVPVLVGAQEAGLNEYDIVLHKGETYQIVVTNKTFNVLKEVQEKGEMNYSIGNSQIATISNSGLVTGAKEGKTTAIVNKVGSDSISIANVTVLPDGVDIEPMAKTCMSHTVVLKANGTVWSYGVNSSYELGNGTTTSSDRPVQVKFPEGTIIKQIAVGNTHNLALDTDGNVWGWGVNSNNSLGRTASKPVNLGISNVKKIAANNDQSMILTTDGYVYVWGLNENGELGTGTYNTVKTPTLLNYVSDILDISLGKNHSILLTTNGKVLTSGLNVYGQTGKEEGKSNTFTQIEVPVTIGKISAGDNHSVLLSTTGDVYTFGYNEQGQLGLGTKQNVKIPTKTSVSNIMDISAGKNQTIVLGANRMLYSTGSNSNGQLGLGIKDDKLLFTEITKVDDMMSISCGNTYNVAIKYDGDVYGWGDYYHGTTVVKTKTNSRVPVKVGNDSTYIEEPEISVNVDGTKQIQITPKYSFNVFKDDEEESDFKFESINNEIATVDEKGVVTGVKTGTTWVKVTENSTGKQDIVIVRVIEKDATYVPQIAGGDGYAAVLKGDGSIWGFGYNSDGQLGNDKLIPINIPSQTNILATYKQVDAGKKFTLALRADGTVWAWGDNTYGVLGQGNRVSARKPVQVQSLTNIVAISAGDNHAIALDSLGNVYTWGLNSSGQLGNGNTQTVSVPEKINSIGNQIVGVSAGGNLSAIVDSTGAVYVFGDNSKEQIEPFKYNYDEFGQKILPALNTYISEPEKVSSINNAVKVECLQSGFVILKADGSVAKTNKYAKEQNIVLENVASSNIVDISATNENIVLLDKDLNTYTFGDNKNGQAGIGTTSDKVSLQKVNMIEGKTYFNIGAGYKNNYIIDTEGFMYGAGSNEYGQLGNSTYDDSLQFTLVGDRKFEIVPDARTMKQPEEETVSIQANVFNVFNHNERKLTDYEWSSSNTDVVVVNDGVLVSQDMGTATITAKDKATGVTATALRVVQPLDEQRIDSISVNGKEAKISGENKYEVSVEKNADGTGTLIIKTKDSTDQISIDEGTTYSEGTLTQDIQLDTKTKVVKIRVKVSNGKLVDYILTINVISNDATLAELTVDDVVPTAISSTEYEIIVKDTVTKPVIHAVANYRKATVSIDAGIPEKKESTKTVDISTVIKKTIPIQVTAENGDVVTYSLTIYKQDALTQLESIMVNGKEATKLSEFDYKAIIPKDTDSSEIIAKAIYSKARAEINGLGEEVQITTRTVATIQDETIVKIYVRAGKGENEREKVYTLTIDKEGTEDIQGLFSVTVNGKEIKPVGKIYNAYIGDKTSSVIVEAITISDKDLVKIGDTDAKVHISTQTVETNEGITTYTITVIDPEDSTKTKEYTLNIKKPSADNSLMSITVGNKEFSKEAVKQNGSNIYKVSISDKYEKVDVIAKANYEQADISVNHEEYEKGVSSREVQTGESEPTKVDILIKATNGDVATYTLEIYKENSNNNLKQVTVDGNKATLSKTENDTYEYTLDKIVDKVTIGAIAEELSSKVGINSYEQEKSASYRDVKFEGRSITVSIPVTSEDGTTRTYKLIVYALPDNVNLSLVKVNGKTANAVPVNKYEARVNKNATSFELYAIPEDPKAKVQIDSNTEVTGTANATISKNSDEVTVTIKVTAQDGTTQTYTVVVTNQSDDCKLAILKVDGETLQPDETGVYKVDKKFLTESVDVQAIANNNYASVSINGTTPTLEEQTSNVTTPDMSNTIKIKVRAEDGTSKEYTLIVNKLSNETGAKITVSYVVDGAVKEQEVELDENNKGVLRIQNQESVDIKVVAKDPLAKVSINGSLSEVKQMVETIPTTEETTNVPIQVISQDGTIGNYEITIIRASKDNNLASISAEGIDQDDIVKTSDNSYTIKMPDTMNILKLKAIAESEFATVKIDNGEYSSNNTQESEIQVDDLTKQIKIYVKSESGDIKEYLLTIQKVTDLRLDSVKVDDQECIIEDGNYVAFIDNGTKEVALKITPKNKDALIATKESTDSKWGDAESKDVHIKQINITGEETTVLIQAKDPADSTRIKEYSVIIKYKSSNSDLELIRVDDKDAIKMDDGYYAITTMNASTSKIYVKAVNKYAKVSISSFDAEQGSSERNVNLSSEKITTVVVTITSQDGKSTNTFNILIERKSEDTSCTILINNSLADEIDEQTHTYTKYIERSVTEATILVTTDSDVATVEIAGEKQTKLLAKTVEIANEITQVDAIVTAENGEKVVNHINIVKKSTDNTIASVKVDGSVIEEIDGKYVATVYDKGKSTQDVSVEVTANEKHSTIQIGEGKEWQQNPAKSTETFKDGNRKITLSINVKAQDQNTDVLTKELEINIVSDDVSIKTVKNGDNVVTDYDEQTHTYKEYLSKDIEEVSLSIEANSPYSTVTSGETTGKQIISINNISVKNQEEVDITVTVTAESGKSQDYTIKLLRKSDNANASHIYVDGVDIIDRFEDKDSVPTCVISIEKNKNSTLIEAISENEFANIKIGDTDSVIKKARANIQLDTEKSTITVPIVITSQDGTVTKTYNILFVRLSNDTKIQWLEVNKKHIIEDENGNYEVTVKATQEIANVRIVLSNILATVTMGGDVKQGELEENIILPEIGDTKKTITVTAMDGTVRTCTLTIHKQVNNLGLEKVYLNGRIATKVDDNTFKIDVKKGTSLADIKAIASKSDEYVSIQNNSQTKGENTYKNCTITSKEIPIKVTAMFDDEVDEQKQYKLIINEVEAPDVVEDLKVTIKLDDEEIPQDTDGNYVKVVSNDKDNGSLWAGITSETSKVKIKDDNGETDYEYPSSQKNITLQNGVTEVTVTVKNGASEEKEYMVYIIKDTEDLDNANIKEIIAGKGAVTEGVISPEQDGSYTTFIKKGETTIELTAKSEYPYSKVSIDGNQETRGTNTNNINMGDLSEKQVIVKITSIDGTTEQYIVNIYREPSELDLKSVFVDNRQATKVDDTNYTIDIVKGTKTVDIKAILYSDTEYVSIANNDFELQENTLNNYDIANGLKIKIIASNKLDNTADDYIQKEYILTLTQVDKEEDLKDLQLTIKVDNKEVQKQDDGIYIAKVNKENTSSIVEASSTSITTQVKINDKQFRAKTTKEKVELPEDITEVTICAKNGAVNQVEYKLYIVKEGSKEDNDFSLKEVKANEKQATLKDDGTYEVEVKASETKVNLEAIATQKLAFVSVDGNKETRGSNIKEIDMTDKTIKEVKVIVTSLSGDKKEYTVKIHRLSAISGKVITQAKDLSKQSATIVVYNSNDTRKEDDLEDPRKVIQEIQINPDGTFSLDLVPDEYDIIVKKTSYLEHRLTNIVVKDGEIVTIDDINIYAGDIVKSGEIEIEDLVSLNDNIGVVITDENKDEKSIYDLNEDGVIDKLDRNILKKNYSKQSQTVKWVDPNSVKTLSLASSNEQQFILPLNCKYTITSNYGTRVHPITGKTKKHSGIDISGTHHAQVLAIADGQVTFAGVQNGYGNCIEIKHTVNGKTIYSFYAHLSEIDVKVGDKVVQGQVIGLEGGDPKTDPNPGSSTGHHLHFEIRTASGSKNDVDPTEYIKF